MEHRGGAQGSPGFEARGRRKGYLSGELGWVLDLPEIDDQMGNLSIVTKHHKVGVWVAYLPAPTDLLIKNPKLIADPVAIGS